MKQMKPFKKLTMLLMFIFFVGGLFFLIFYKRAIDKPLKSNKDVITIEVRNGEGFYDILNKLDKENELRNKLLIKIKLSIDKKNIKLNEGIYEIDTNTTLAELINSLENSADNLNVVKVTIPEGSSIEEIAQIIDTNGFCTKDEFIQAVKNYELPSFIQVNEKKKI